MYKIGVLNRFILLYIAVWLKLRKSRYIIPTKKLYSNQSCNMFNLIGYADFNVRNEGDRTEADAKNNL